MEYRVYDKVNKRYMDVVQVCFESKPCVTRLRPGITGIYEDCCYFVSWEDAVLERNTRIMDREKQFIFEGDVVRGFDTWNSGRYTGVVEYHPVLGSFVLNLPSNDDLHQMVELCMYDDLVILGSYTPDSEALRLSASFKEDETSANDA